MLTPPAQRIRATTGQDEGFLCAQADLTRDIGSELISIQQT